VNAADEKGSTALIEAARWGKREICEALLQRGADFNAKDEEGNTARTIGQGEVVKLLETWAAKQGAAAEAESCCKTCAVM